MEGMSKRPSRLENEGCSSNSTTSTPFSIKDILAKSEAAAGHRNDYCMVGEEGAFSQQSANRTPLLNDDYLVYQNQSILSNLQRYYVATNALQSLLLFSALPRINSTQGLDYMIGRDNMAQWGSRFFDKKYRVNSTNDSSLAGDEGGTTSENESVGESFNHREASPATSSSSGSQQSNLQDSPLHELEKLTCITFQGMEKQNLQLHTIANGCDRRPKRRKCRTTFTSFQLSVLEKRFQCHHYLTPSDRDNLAKTLNLTSLQVITWFQNRRAKLKRDVQELKDDLKTIKTWITPEVGGNVGEGMENELKHINLNESFQDMDTE